ncbi:MAG: heavy-metal-associated domain-containing protein [candidate division WOR-3 bacterium]
MIVIRVPDMSCQMCFRRVEEALIGVLGVENVMIDPETKEVFVEGNPNRDELIAAIMAVGYHPEE